MASAKKRDTLIDRVVERIIKENFISSPFIQRKFQISYLGAQKVIKKLEEMGYIEKGEQFTKRRVLKHKFIQ